MPVSLAFARLRRLHKKIKQEFEANERWKRIELLTLARANYYAIQASQELPPTKAQAKRKNPNWTEIEKARREMLKQIDTWQKALSHPYYFEEMFGLGHMFEEPEEEVHRSRITTREEIDNMKNSLISKLSRMRDTFGDQDLREVM